LNALVAICTGTGVPVHRQLTAFDDPEHVEECLEPPTWSLSSRCRRASANPRERRA
jgi:hypothetical protein